MRKDKDVLNLLRKRTGFLSERNRRPVALAATAALMPLISCGLVTGCASKAAETVAVTEQTPSAGTVTANVTPEQEAARQRAMKQGEELQAAQQAERSGQ